jgi:hypothetical protein
MSAATAVQAAVAFTWLGMVLAISFLETPLKFRAPGISVTLAVGIGRLVFRALNMVEAVFAFGLVIAVILAWPTVSLWRAALMLAVIVVLIIGAAVLRPAMDARIGAGQPTGQSTNAQPAKAQPRHRLHVGYVALECVKVVLLLVIGVSGLVG